MNYETLLQELFKAYYDCRKNKRKTINQLQFEMDYESNLIKPYILYSGKRTKGNFYEKIQKLNNEVKMKYSCHYLAGPDNPENLNQLTRSSCQARGGQIFKNKSLSIINSYLGFLKHYKSYNIRKKLLLQKIHPSFWNEFYISGGYVKLMKKRM